MICRIGDVVRCGRVVSIEQSVDPATVVDSVRSAASDSEAAVAVSAATPQPIHDNVGYLHHGIGLRIRTALARAGRSRGLTTPYDEALRDRRNELNSFTDHCDPVEPYRRKLAETREETETLREEVAAARGRLQAEQEGESEPTDTASALENAIRRLSEVETSAVAARQQLERARTNAREQRDRRERKRELEDKIANLERRARSHLVETLRNEYETALSQVPEHTNIPQTANDPFAAESLPAALAIARVADLSAPLVLACDCFESARTASEWLDVSVLQI